MTKQTSNAIDTSFSISKLYMWRCVVTMAHADGLIHETERTHLTNIFDKMREKAGLAQEDYILLISDLSSPQDPLEMLKHINEPQYRAQVVYFARLLAYKDGHMHPTEQELLDKLHAGVTDGLNMDEIRREVQNNVGQDLTLHQVEIDSQRPDEGVGLYRLIDALCLHFGIDLMDE
jgi:uncharacterized membrane protein YebE (DUF533 family)